MWLSDYTTLWFTKYCFFRNLTFTYIFSTKKWISGWCCSYPCYREITLTVSWSTMHVVEERIISIVISFLQIFHVRINHPGIRKCFFWNWHFRSWTRLMALMTQIPDYTCDVGATAHDSGPNLPQVQYHPWTGSWLLEQSNCSHKAWIVFWLYFNF